jgi:SAM-dependent methyltransferase
MNDQRQHWDQLHNQGGVNHHLDKPNSFAQEVLTLLDKPSNVLELGCGVGNDSIAFAKAGHTILATDFSEVAITTNTEFFKDESKLFFEVLDMNSPIKLEKNSFDAIYARLSLHYFSDQRTKAIFQELHGILKPNGLLCFICKSTNDSLYGKGKAVEKDMFEYNGHIRHFFSEEYAKECLGNKFSIEKIESGTDNFYERESGFVKVIARAIK